MCVSLFVSNTRLSALTPPPPHSRFLPHPWRVGQFNLFVSSTGEKKKYALPTYVQSKFFLFLPGFRIKIRAHSRNFRNPVKSILMETYFFFPYTKMCIFFRTLFIYINIYLLFFFFFFIEFRFDESPRGNFLYKIVFSSVFFVYSRNWNAP